MLKNFSIVKNVKNFIAKKILEYYRICSIFWREKSPLEENRFQQFLGDQAQFSFLIKVLLILGLLWNFGIIDLIKFEIFKRFHIYNRVAHILKIVTYEIQVPSSIFI